MALRSILVVATVASLAFVGFSSSSHAADGQPQEGGPKQGPDDRAADLKARIGDLEQRVGACKKAAEEYAASGRQELAESHMRVARALAEEAQRIRERLAGGGERGGDFERMSRAVAELKAESTREEKEGHVAQAEGREADAKAHMERSGMLWKKAEEIEAQLKARAERGEKREGGGDDGWRREMRAQIAKLLAAAAEMEAKRKEADATGYERDAATYAENAKAFHAEADAIHAKMEAMTKERRAAGEDRPREKGDKPKDGLPAEGTGRQDRAEMREQMERMRAQMEEMRRIIEDLRKAVESLRAANTK